MCLRCNSCIDCAKSPNLALENVSVLVGGLVLVVQHLDEFLVLDILVDMIETDQLPVFAGGLLVLSALSLLVLRTQDVSVCCSYTTRIMN